MTEILKFPTPTERSPPVYQLHRFAPGGGVRTTLSIYAHTDVAARRRARELDDGVRAELWCDGRFLGHFGRADHPVATSIRSLGGPTPPAAATDTCASSAPKRPE